MEIQRDWQEVCLEGGEFWVMCAHPTHSLFLSPDEDESVLKARHAHGKIRVDPALTKGSPPVLTPSTPAGEPEPFLFNIRSLDMSRNRLQLEAVNVRPGLVTTFCAPGKAFSPLPHQIYGVAVSEKSDHGICCGEEGLVRVWNKNTGQLEKDCAGHYGDVNTVSMFPSGLVAMSGGADMTLKIWTVEDGACVATLKGHTAGVVSSGIIGTGKNVVSAGRDGTVRLWDVSTQACTKVIGDTDAGIRNINDVCVSDGKIIAPLATEGKVLLTAHDDCVGVHDLRHDAGRESLSLHWIAGVSRVHLEGTRLIAGTLDGFLVEWDARKPDAPLAQFKVSYTSSPVTSLTGRGHGLHVWFGTFDGRCGNLDLTTGEVNVILSGPDVDPVYGMAADTAAVYTCSRDKTVRRYEVSDVL